MVDHYRPNPINTEEVVLPKEIFDVAELLAKNTHENWAKKRLEEGWRYGPVRDDAAKATPCLVPYEELTESEKEYDRMTSQQTLKVLYAMGYRLVKGEKSIERQDTDEGTVRGIS